jgi:hypothetical protein
MRRDDFLEACGLVAAVGTALMRPVRALARRAEPEPATLPPDSAYERMKRLRIDYMLAVGDPQRRYAINREFIALAFEMKAAGASRADGAGDALPCEAGGRPAGARWHEGRDYRLSVSLPDFSEKPSSNRNITVLPLMRIRINSGRIYVGR